MLIVNGKMMLNVDNQVIMPGERKDLPDKTAEKLAAVGLVEKATKSRSEKAVKPEPEELTGKQKKKLK